MEQTSSEIFCQFIYDESFTYDELLQIEENLISSIEDLLHRSGAEHIDFTPLGDTLMLQCAYSEHKIYIFRKLACKLAELLPPKISGRVVCLSHALDACQVYWLKHNEWQEQNIPLPETPPEGLRSWKAGEE